MQNTMKALEEYAIESSIGEGLRQQMLDLLVDEGVQILGGMASMRTTRLVARIVIPA